MFDFARKVLGLRSEQIDAVGIGRPICLCLCVVSWDPKTGSGMTRSINGI